MYYRSMAIGVALMTMATLPWHAVHAQSETGRVEFTVRTSSPNGNYSPRNIGAIWIEDAAGQFVKTLTVWANRRMRYLYTWDAASGRNTVDAVTSATASSHGTHTASWDLTDVNGDPVPAGTYTLRLEMTDEHSQGPLTAFSVPVGQPSDTLVLPEENYFHDMELRWYTPLTGIGSGGRAVPAAFALEPNFPNPFNPSTTVRFTLSQPGPVRLTVYSVNGEAVATLVSERLAAGTHTRTWNADGMPSGVYFLRMAVGEASRMQKMVLMK